MPNNEQNEVNDSELNNVEQEIVIPEVLPKVSKIKKLQKKKSKIGTGSGGPREKIPTEVIGHIIGAYLSGMYKTQTEIAATLGVSDTIVSETIGKIPAEYLPLKDENKNKQIADGILDMIQEGLSGMKQISRQTQNETWMMNQSADELGSLYDIQGRTIIRIMELMERSDAAAREALANNSEKIINQLTDGVSNVDNIKQDNSDNENLRESIQDSI